MDWTTWLVGIGFIAFLAVTQLGHRRFVARRAYLPLAALGYASYAFTRGVPASVPDVVALAVAAAAGVLLGGALLLTVRVGHEREGGAPYTEIGVGYLALWTALFAARLALVYGIQHWFTQSFGEFMVAHHVSFEVIAPAFVISAAAMMVVRVAGVALRLAAPEGGAAGRPGRQAA